MDLVSVDGYNNPCRVNVENVRGICSYIRISATLIVADMLSVVYVLTYLLACMLSKVVMLRYGVRSTLDVVALPNQMYCSKL